MIMTYKDICILHSFVLLVELMLKVESHRVHGITYGR